MAVAARAWQHPRWEYDENDSEAARRSAARSRARQPVDAPRAPRGQSRPPRAQSSSARAQSPSTRANTDRRSAPVVVREPLSAPGLRLVPRSRTRFGSTMLVTLALAFSLLLPVALNTLVVRTQMDIARLQGQQDDLVAQRSALRAQQATLSATQRVKETADRLGMVTPTEVGFIDLAGTVPVGQEVASAASGGDADRR